MINFKATLHAIRMDKESEFKVILTVPKSEHDSMTALTYGTEQVLDVSIEVDSFADGKKDNVSDSDKPDLGGY